MGRPKKQNPEPFWRTQRGSWFVQIAKKQVRLSLDKDEAWRLWHELMMRSAGRDEDRLADAGG